MTIHLLCELNTASASSFNYPTLTRTQAATYDSHLCADYPVLGQLDPAQPTMAAIKAALWAFIAFALLAWILSIIGLAGLQRNCYTMVNPITNAGGLGLPGVNPGVSTNTFGPTWGVRGFNNNLECSDVFRYYWFMFAFEIVTLVGLAVLAAVGFLAASALSWLAWLTVLTMLHIQGADSFLALKNSAYGQGNAYDFARLTAAGWILTALANLALIFLLGWRPRKLRNSAGGPIKYGA